MEMTTRPNAQDDKRRAALEWMESYRQWFSERWPESIGHLDVIKAALTQQCEAVEVSVEHFIYLTAHLDAIQVADFLKDEYPHGIKIVAAKKEVDV